MSDTPEPGAILARPLRGYERFLIYGAIGLLFEVAYTALYGIFWGEAVDPRLVGQTYLWMHPIWAAGLYFIEWGGPRLRSRGLGWFTRAAVWVACAFALEYSSGWILRAVVGRAPWDYSASAANVDGLIRLDYAHGWALIGLTAERVTGFFCALRIRVPRRAAAPAPVEGAALVDGG
jgi:hypothetical protein